MSDQPTGEQNRPSTRTTRIKDDSPVFRYVVPVVLAMVGLGLVGLLGYVVLMLLGVVPGL